MDLNANVGLENWELATAKKLISEYRRKHMMLAQEEFDDLLQDCLAHWIAVRQRIPASADARPPVSYMARVMRNRLADTLRSSAANKRSRYLRAVSLDAPIDGTEGGITLGEMLSGQGTNQPGLSAIDFHHARIDLVRVLTLLNPAQQQLCRLLGEDGLTIKEAAERLRIPRGTLYEEIKRIRRFFDQQGLDNYLKG